MIYTAIVGKIQRAQLNGERLHLSHAERQALIESAAFDTLLQLSREELAKTCRAPRTRPTRAASSSAPIGLHGAPTEANGQSAGMTPAPAPADAPQPVAAITTAVIHLARQNKRSQRISREQAAVTQPQLPHTHPLQLVSLTS